MGELVTTVAPVPEHLSRYQTRRTLSMICKIIGHRDTSWASIGWSNRKEAGNRDNLVCSVCRREILVITEDLALDELEALWHVQRFVASNKAFARLLDDVEPSISVGRDAQPQ